MARKRSSILPLESSSPPLLASERGRGARIWLLLALVGAVVLLAWFDGGEEPMRPISHEIPLPEAR